jgi:hypothetical protein
MAPKSSGRLPTIVEDLSEVDPAFKVRLKQISCCPEFKMLKQTVSISDFELLEYSIHARAKLCRKRSTNRLYALKTFPNCAMADPTERIILRMINDIQASFLPPVHWFFQDEDDFHMVMVCLLDFSFLKKDTYVKKKIGILSSGQSLHTARSPWRFPV